LSFAVSVTEVQLVKLVDEFSTADEIAGFVPLPPTILVDGNPAPSAARKMSAVTEPLGLHIITQPCNVPPNGILIGFLVPVVSTVPAPSTASVTLCSIVVVIDVAPLPDTSPLNVMVWFPVKYVLLSFVSVFAPVRLMKPLDETPVMVSSVIDPPRAVDVPAIVIAELLSVAFAIALSVRTPALESVAVAPEPLSVTGA
jgi:hypothetical protein